MNTHMKLSLDDHSAGFIEQQVDGGNFASASEVVAAGLKLLEAEQAYVEAVRAALIEGEESGEPQPFDLQEFLAEMHRERAK
ncbi:MAG: type II toxin-antitoxin system ParD family antitoxin [Mesorhizobium sp.]|nr:type II toxin-antitoxin system ParD family antitoxin [Mesorhizobium sp.]MCO5162356.1 type II toxin-antitoxin system ParD family antitoxin [Mesorhizobium sp.]